MIDGSSKAIFTGCLERCRGGAGPGFGGGRAGRVMPGVFDLHVSPSACGRRLALMSYKNKTRLKRAHLYITEQDLILGNAERLILEAVKEILSAVEPVPRAIMITLTCIDELVATDNDVLLARLKMEFPYTNFAINHINPIMRDSANPAPVNMQLSRYQLLEPSKVRDNGINLIGEMRSVSRESELFEFAEELGLVVRQSDDFKTFDGFLTMANSCLNVVVGPFGCRAAIDMEKRLSIPYYYAPAEYYIDRIQRDYEKIAEMIGRDCPDMRTYHAKAEQEIEKTLSLVGNIPLVMDRTVASRPVSLARALAEYGFRVGLVIEDMLMDGDTTDLDWLRASHPEIIMVNGRSKGGDMAQYKQMLGECMCLGTHSARSLDAEYVVDLHRNGFGYGYQAVCQLMQGMRSAYHKGTGHTNNGNR